MQLYEGLAPSWGQGDTQRQALSEHWGKAALDLSEHDNPTNWGGQLRTSRSGIGACCHLLGQLLE